MIWQINGPKPIEKIIPGSLCYLVRDGKVLLLQRRNPPHIGMWSPPGGKMHPRESPQECIMREFREETGLTVRDLQLRAVTTVLHAGLAAHWLLFVYRAGDYSGELISGVEGDLQWVDLTQLAHYPRPEADIQIFGHVLSDAPVQEMQFGYDAAEQLVKAMMQAE
jgi:8-oxo-dGTP diphosphatase